MKKWIALLSAAALCLSLGACGSSNGGTPVSGEQAANHASAQQNVGMETSSTISWGEELKGYWVTDDNLFFHPSVGGSSFSFDDPVSWMISPLTDYVTEGNKLILPYSDGTKFVYEATQGEGGLLLKYLPEESNIAEEAPWHATLCNDFTVYPESSTQTVELTLDNWADYLEFRPTCEEIHNSFGELEDVRADSWVLIGKKDAPHIVVGVADAAFEYRLAGGYYRWFTYDLATKEVTPGEPAELDGEYTFDDRTDDFNFYFDSYSNGRFIAWLHGSAVLGVEPIWTDDTCSVIGVDYESKEITRIKGTLTVIG